MDLCGLHMSYGSTFVNHIRASDAKKNFEYEIEGKRWNESFWQEFDKQISKANIADNGDRSDSFIKLAGCLKQTDNVWAQKEGVAMTFWHKLFPFETFS